jgi:hypothetical protein
MGNIYNKMGKQSDNISSENFVCTKIIRKRGDNFFFQLTTVCVVLPGRVVVPPMSILRAHRRLIKSTTAVTSKHVKLKHCMQRCNLILFFVSD